MSEEDARVEVEHAQSETKPLIRNPTSTLLQPPCPEQPLLTHARGDFEPNEESSRQSESPTLSSTACSASPHSSQATAASEENHEQHEYASSPPASPLRSPPIPESPLAAVASPDSCRRASPPSSPEDDDPLPSLMAAASAESYAEYIRQAPPPPPPPPRPEASTLSGERRPHPSDKALKKSGRHQTSQPIGEQAPEKHDRSSTPFVVSPPLLHHQVALHEALFLDDDTATTPTQWDAWVQHIIVDSSTAPEDATHHHAPAHTVADWLDDAHSQGISLLAADAFIDAYQHALLLFSSTTTTTTEADRSHDQKNIDFWDCLVDCLQRANSHEEEGTIGRVERTKEEETATPASVTHDTGGMMEVEIEAFGGYSCSEDAPVDDAEAEPWWTVVERLGGTATVPPPETTYHPAPTSGRSTEDDSAVNKSVDEDIDEFWTERDKRRAQDTRRKAAFANSHKKSVLRQQKIVASSSSSSSSKTSSNSASPQKLLHAMSKFSEQLQSDLNLRPKPINAVSSTRQHISRPCRTSNTNGADVTVAVPSLAKNHWWRLPYDQRTESHDGFLTVDVNSLYSTSRILSDRHELDNVPWESRGVKQRFLQSMTDRNWFGALRKQQGNEVHVQPVCRPQSMEMPMSMSSDHWMEEEDSPRKKAIAALGPEYAPYVGEGFDDDDASWEETPECGRIINVVLQPGERLTRVTPDCTSSLRRSRWRKKYCR